MWDERGRVARGKEEESWFRSLARSQDSRQTDRPRKRQSERMDGCHCMKSPKKAERRERAARKPANRFKETQKEEGMGKERKKRNKEGRKERKKQGKRERERKRRECRWRNDRRSGRTNVVFCLSVWPWTCSKSLSLSRSLLGMERRRRRRRWANCPLFFVRSFPISPEDVSSLVNVVVSFSELSLSLSFRRYGRSSFQFLLSRLFSFFLQRRLSKCRWQLTPNWFDETFSLEEKNTQDDHFIIDFQYCTTGILKYVMLC